MLNHVPLEIQLSGRLNSCDLHLEHRRRTTVGKRIAVVRFPYCILSIVFIIVAVFLICYGKHLDHYEEIPAYSAKDFIRERNRIYSDLFHFRIRAIILRSYPTVTGIGLKRGIIGGVVKRSSSDMTLCSVANGLEILHDKDVSQSPKVSGVEKSHNDIMAGGTWKPEGCIARHRVAIVIPYRDRRQHLITLLKSLVSTLKLQNIHFKIYVSEQYGNETFNKGVLMNAAYKQALQEQDWQCFVFHDVDLIPENITNMYTCPRHPRHMSAAIDEMGYRLPYEHLVGGVFVLRTEHFQQVNGYSNSYWGWGAEDDDMSVRLKQMGLRIDRPPYNIARFKMLKHTKREAAHFKRRYIPLVQAKYKFHIDGLNSVNYKLISKTAQPLYTHLLIDVGAPPE